MQPLGGGGDPRASILSVRPADRDIRQNLWTKKILGSARGALTQSEIPKIPNRYRDVLKNRQQNEVPNRVENRQYNEKPIPT